MFLNHTAKLNNPTYIFSNFAGKYYSALCHHL
jgi:hypothetical protein